MKIIIDASVAAKWFFNEVDKEAADRLLEQIKTETDSIIVPHLFFSEIGNILLKKNVVLAHAREIITALQEVHFEIHDVAYKSFLDVYQNAIDYSLTFYDASYITLMQKENCKFITADKKLYQKVSKKFAHIKLLE